MPRDVRAGFGVHWQQLSDGAAPALSLHCALAYSGAYTGLAAALGDRLQITAPDMPGHGRSDDWDSRCDIHDQLTDIAASFLKDGTHLIGHSFGATVALRLAQNHADKVASLTLIEPVLFAAAPMADPAVHAEFVGQSADYRDAMQARNWTRAAELFSAAWGDGRPWAALPKRQQDGFIARIPLIAETDQILEHDTAGLLAPGRLESILCPTLLIRGSGTMPVITPIHAALMQRLPNAREAVIDGGGHMAPLSHPGEVAAQILAVLDPMP